MTATAISSAATTEKLLLQKDNAAWNQGRGMVNFRGDKDTTADRESQKHCY